MLNGSIKIKGKQITKYTVFIAAVTFLKMLLMGFCSSDYQNQLFLPFVMDFINNGGNVYQRFYYNGVIDAFPYPAVMLLVQTVGAFIIRLFHVSSLFLINFIFKIPSFIIDMIGLYALSHMYLDKRRYIAVFYYASPVIIYGVYMHGQLDLIPTMLMFFAIILIVSKKKKRYLFGGLLTIAALLSKLHILAVLPIVVVYIWNRDGIKKAAEYMALVTTGTILGICPFLSEGFIQCVLLNREQNVLTQVYFQFASVRLYIPIAMVLVVYLLTYKLTFMNAELFMNLCSMVFAVFLAFCPPMPGWYVWIIPYVTLFFINVDQEKYKNITIYALLNLLYLVYFVLCHSRQYVDLYIRGTDMSFLKINNDKVVNFTFTLLVGTLLYLIFSMYHLSIASNSLYKRKNMPFTIGISGDSGSGKSTMIHMIQACLGVHNLSFIEGDGDHRWERGDEYWNNYTALNPKANYLYRQSEDLEHIRWGSSIARVDYDHNTGKFTDRKKVKVKKYMILCGLHSMYLPQTRKNLDIKIYMDADENLRRYWKIERDTMKRGYAKEEIVRQIEERMPDAVKYIYPQKQFADFVVKYYDKTLKDCMINEHEVKLSLQLIISAAVNVEPLVDEIRKVGLEISYDYSDDLESQIVDIDADNLEKMRIPVQQIADHIIPQLDEITREDLTDIINGKDGVVALFLLLLISNKMRGGWKKRMIKGVIFDLDNTVYNYDMCHEYAMKKLGEYVCQKYTLNLEQFVKAFDEAKNYVKKRLGNTGASHNRMLYMQTFLEIIGEKPALEAIMLYDFYWDAMFENMRAFDYVIPLMEQLKKRKIMIGILTDLTAHIQHRKLAHMGLSKYVDIMVTSEEAGQEKPSEAAFELMIEKSGVLPWELLMIGDSYEKDIRGAENIGMNAMLFEMNKKDSMMINVLECLDG